MQWCKISNGVGTCAYVCPYTSGTAINTLACGCGDQLCNANANCHVVDGTGTCVDQCADTSGTHVNAPKCACADTICDAHHSCSVSGGTGTCLAQCVAIDGTAKDNNVCACGNSTCSANQYCVDKLQDKGCKNYATVNDLFDLYVWGDGTLLHFDITLATPNTAKQQLFEFCFYNSCNGDSVHWDVPSGTVIDAYYADSGYLQDLTDDITVVSVNSKNLHFTKP